MTFKDFWKSNKDRYLKIAELNVKLAINCAAEDAWDARRGSLPTSPGNVPNCTCGAFPEIHSDFCPKKLVRKDPVDRLEENKTLRELLWRMHGHDFKITYGDDGEMQCGECLQEYGFYDWKRTPASEIEDMILRANLREINSPDEIAEEG